MLGPRRFLVVLGAVLLVSGSGVPSSVAASGTTIAPRPLPKAAARLVAIGPNGATYVLPGGRRMVLSRRTGTVDVRGEGATLIVFGVVRAHGRRFGFTLEAMSGTGGGPQDGVFFAGLGIGRGDFAGNRFGLQVHSYELDSLDAPWVDIRHDLSRGWMSTGSALGRWGRVHLTLTANGPPIVRCHGRSIVQPASVTGGFSFTPQGDNGFFGTIASARATRASIRLMKGKGCGGGATGGHGPRRCPSQPLSVGANHLKRHTFVGFFGSTFRDGRRDMVSADYQQWIGRWNVFHEIDALVGTNAIHAGHDHIVTLRGIPRAYMSGEATFSPVGPPQHLWHRRTCGHGRFFTPLGWNGHMSSAAGAPLTARFVTGSVSIPETPRRYFSFLERIRIARP